MVESSVVVSIVIAVVSLIGTVAAAIIGYWANEKEAKERRLAEERLQAAGIKLEHDSHARLNLQNQYLEGKLQEQQSKLDEELQKKQEQRLDAKAIAELTAKYSPPLMIAAYELQARLFELLEYPISKEHLETVEGLEDIKIFTCYRFAQFLAWTYILETKTQYFSFTDDPKLQKIGYIILRLNEEFDRRRNRDGDNIGVWPGSRLLISARMIRDDVKEQDVPLDMIVKTYDIFRDEWAEKFKGPMSFFCHWIDRLVEGRLRHINNWDDAMRCTQHNLVVMVETLDTKSSINHSLRCEQVKSTHWFCDCRVCNWPEEWGHRLEYRKRSRDNDIGLKPSYKAEKAEMDSSYRESINMERFNSYTDTERFNPWLYGREKERRESTESALLESESD